MLNDKLKVYLFILISFFPVFVLRSNFSLIEIIYSILVFFIPILLINLFFITKPPNNNYFILYLSMVIVFGIDNNLGLWNGFIAPYTFDFIRIFRIIYIPAFICLILMIILIFILLKITDTKFQNVILIFLLTIFIFNVFDQTKSYKNIIDFKNLSNRKHNTTRVVIVFDEMSGLNSYESLNYEKQEFDNYAKGFFKKHNFEFYSNVKSITRDTITSLTSMLNLSNDENIRDNLIVKSNLTVTGNQTTVVDIEGMDASFNSLNVGGIATGDVSSNDTVLVQHKSHTIIATDPSGWFLIAECDDLTKINPSKNNMANTINSGLFTLNSTMNWETGATNYPNEFNTSSP